MEPPNDAEAVGMEVDGGAATDLQPYQVIYMNLSHEGRYIQHIHSVPIFEVTAKYNPLIMLLGRGAFSSLCSVMNSETNETVAMKKIMHACRDQITAKRTLREIKLLRHFEHENIVGIKDVVLPPQRDAFEDVYIAYELMDTDLEKIIQSNQELTIEHHQAFMYQFLRGLKYIHSANVLHRDLKPNNILLNLNWELKICDFGLARAASDAMTDYVAPTWYHAPELLLNSSAYTSATDVWSAGCIFLEMMTGTPLFPGTDRAHQLRLILEFLGSPTEDDIGWLNESTKQGFRMLPRSDRQCFYVKFPKLPFEAVMLLEKMLKFDPRKRISVAGALAHPYFKFLHNINNEPVCMNFFNYNLEEHPITVEQIKELIYLEAVAFNPGLATVQNEALAYDPGPPTVEDE